MKTINPIEFVTNLYKYELTIIGEKQKLFYAGLLDENKIKRIMKICLEIN